MKMIKLNLARNCLRSIIKIYGIKEINIPYYICPTLRQAIQCEDCKIKFYHIDDNFYPTKNFKSNEFIVYPNYFGICSENVLKLSKKYKNLIVDNAQSFFMKPVGLASFFSLRKFFNVSDGAYLYVNKNIDLKLEREENYDYNFANFEEFVKNELRLNATGPKLISEDTEKYMKTVNIEMEKEKRLKNFYEYDKKFSAKNILKINLGKNDVPYCYPLLASEYIDVSKFSAKPILRFWSSLPKEFNEYKFYKYLIPIIL